MRTTTIITLFLLAAGHSLAQTHRTFQATFISPMGTNGVESPAIDNTVSINILGGVNGGSRAFEMGGVMNWNQGSVTGLQMAGITNVVRGQVRGAQIGGIYNFSQFEQSGLQMAGIANTAFERAKGLALAGIVNYQGGSQGASIAGITNVNTGHMEGAQIAGIANVSSEDAHGAQIGGITNVVDGTVSGLQLSGIYNYSTRLEGVQVGLINYTDSVVRGVPFGFISVVGKNGYRRMEFEANETFYGNLSFKTGVKHLYNIFSIGGNPDHLGYWGPGYGLGSAREISQRLEINIDLVAYQVNEGEAWTDELNLMNRLKLNFAYQLTSSIQLVGGPVYVVAVSKISDAEGNAIGGSYLPSWSLSDRVHRGTRVTSYLGFNLGIRL